MEGNAYLDGLDEEKHFRLVWDLGDLDAAERLEAEHEKPYKALFDALAAGRIDSFDFSGNHSSGNYNWYIVTRSTRPCVLLQISVVWVRPGGEMLPLSHSDINSFAEFRDRIPQAGAVVHWLRLPAAA